MDARSSWVYGSMYYISLGLFLLRSGKKRRTSARLPSWLLTIQEVVLHDLFCYRRSNRGSLSSPILAFNKNRHSNLRIFIRSVGCKPRMRSVLRVAEFRSSCFPCYFYWKRKKRKRCPAGLSCHTHSLLNDTK